ncbi:MAG TPA: hypothetical protein VF532_05555 [Candidatus Angelobacter sp.]
MKIKTFFFLAVVAASLVCGFPLSAQEGPADARTLLQLAHENSDLKKLVPYEFHAVVVLNPGVPEQKKGKIIIYRDKDRSRTELQIEDYREVKLTLGNKLYVARSTPMPIPGLTRLAESDRAWDRMADDGDAKLGDVSQKKVQNMQAQCFDVKGPRHHRLCFDPAKKILLENLDRQRAVEFTDYKTVEQVQVPGKITLVAELEKKELPILVIEQIEARPAVFTAASFAVPEHALELETCEGLEQAKPLKTPSPDFGANVVRRNMATPLINAYGIIDKDGSLQNIKVLTGNAELRDVIVETLKNWRYHPAMCGNNPVATEKEIPISLLGAMGGGGDDAPRGRSR